MELIALILMLGAGVAIAVIVSTAVAVSGRAAPEPHLPQFSERDQLAASLLFHVFVAGGAPEDRALRWIRGTGNAAPVSRPIDVVSWGERYAHLAGSRECEHLLESAVRVLSGEKKAVPLLQYVALLDLSFSLGFQTDRLARLRQQYGFDYVDHARDARPREAGRAGGASPIERPGPEQLSALLGVQGEPTRASVVAAYRRAAAATHPDRFHGAGQADREAAAARFIEMTRAYEALLAFCED